MAKFILEVHESSSKFLKVYVGKFWGQKVLSFSSTFFVVGVFGFIKILELMNI